MAPFAGWDMPVQYDGVIEEHRAVRGAAGIFDVSHMGEIETSGPDAEKFLQRVLSNDVGKLALGGAQYSVLCRQDGGVIDDLFTYRLDGGLFLTVTNASNHAKDFAWFVEQSEGFDVELIDACERYAMLAVQGPLAREIVQSEANAPLPARMHTARATLDGADALVCGTGYTGEDGVEILLAPNEAPRLWARLLARGAKPAGLAARDTLRTEACFHLYGNDLMESRGPIEAALGWCCKEETGFVGADAVRAARARGPRELLVPFEFTGPGIPRPGCAVVGGGEVTSGTHSPCLGVGIGLAYVPVERAAAGTALQVDVRGKLRDAVTRTKPLYPKIPIPST